MREYAHTTIKQWKGVLRIADTLDGGDVDRKRASATKSLRVVWIDSSETERARVPERVQRSTYTEAACRCL